MGRSAMAHLRASAIIFKRLLPSLAIGTAGFSLPAAAHEVFASTVTVSRDQNRVEILQTSPIGVLQNLQTVLERDVRETPSTNGSLLKTLARQWSAASTGKACSLIRQAYRSLESGHEVQFRFLFSCDEDAENIMLSAKWVEMTPPSHFILFDMEYEGKALQTIMEKRPAEIVIPRRQSHFNDGFADDYAR